MAFAYPRRLNTLIVLCFLAVQGLFFASSWAQEPNWSVNPADYQLSMNMTGVLWVSGIPADSPGNLLAAFVDGEVRGVVGPTEVNGTYLFFLTVYANTNDEEVTFKAFVDDLGKIIDTNNTLDFEADATLGSLSAPYPWSITDIASCPTGRPDWNLNPAEFESSMNVTATVFLNSFRPSDANNLLAAFVGDEIRGIAEPTFINGEPLYFLTVYANENGETVSFQHYTSESDEIHTSSTTLEYTTNAIIGQVNEPFELEGSCPAQNTSTQAPGEILSDVILYQNYPNPFNPETSIRFSAMRPGIALIRVYGLRGELIATLFDNPVTRGQIYEVQFNASGLASGMYFYTLEFEGKRLLRPMMLLK